MWSIGAKYKTVVVPLVRRVAATFAADEPAPLIAQLPAVDPVSLPRLLEAFPDITALTSVTNGQLTSSGRSRLRMSRATRTSSRPRRELPPGRRRVAHRPRGPVDLMNADLTAIPGEGTSGVRRGYLWMLIGDDSGVKPDRMILAWLHQAGAGTDTAGARALLTEAAQQLSSASQPVTPWMVDHAIWNAERSRRAGSRSRR